MNIFTSIQPTRHLLISLSILGISTILSLSALAENTIKKVVHNPSATVTVVETKNGTSLIIIDHPSVENHGALASVSLKDSVADSVAFRILTQLTIPGPSGDSLGSTVTIYELMADTASFKVTRGDFNHDGFILLGPRY